MEEKSIRLNFSPAAAFLIRLTPGQNLFEALKSLAADSPSRRIALLSGIGSLTNVAFRNLKAGIERPVSQDKTVLFESSGPYELVSVQGTVIPSAEELVVHLHASLGTPSGAVIGGHMTAATVFTTTELVCLELPLGSLQRRRSEETGLVEMVADKPDN